MCELLGFFLTDATHSVTLSANALTNPVPRFAFGGRVTSAVLITAPAARLVIESHHFEY